MIVFIIIKIYKSVPFNDGDKVRILEKKEKIDKGKQKFSKECQNPFQTQDHER